MQEPLEKLSRTARRAEQITQRHAAKHDLPATPSAARHDIRTVRSEEVSLHEIFVRWVERDMAGDDKEAAAEES